jgi:predicted glycosyltransferase
MVEILRSKRILIYSHDTFGLGHLRRCRTIAHSLVERFKGLTVLILSGSPIIGNFDYRARVDFIRIPGVIKLYNGNYTSLGLHIDLKDTLSIRESIIRHTARTFAPDLMLVDKEPLGLKGEMTETLEMLKSTNTRLVLGLRDVMDDPTRLKREWSSGHAIAAMEDLYDEIWVYGREEFVDPLGDMGLSSNIRNKMIYTGYLPRSLPKETELPVSLDMNEPYVLVTPGGGGDGMAMVDLVLRAYESDKSLPLAALIVLGPFMPHEARDDFIERSKSLDRVKIITFDSRLEVLMANSACVVSMAGYNTFCEILSYDKRALVLPRTEPRKEQLIRALRAEEMGLLKVLIPEGGLDTKIMAQALHDLPHQDKPSTQLKPGMLGGLESIGSIAQRILGNGIDAEVRQYADL